MVLQDGKGLVDPVEQVLPARADRRDERARLVDLCAQLLLRRHGFRTGAPQRGGHRHREEIRQRVAERDLVADRKLDVDALDAVGVIAEALERYDDVFVDLERIGVLGDRGRTGAVEPELLPHLG